MSSDEFSGVLLGRRSGMLVVSTDGQPASLSVCLSVCPYVCLGALVCAYVCRVIWSLWATWNSTNRDLC